MALRALTSGVAPFEVALERAAAAFADAPDEVAVAVERRAAVLRVDPELALPRAGALLPVLVLVRPVLVRAGLVLAGLVVRAAALRAGVLRAGVDRLDAAVPRAVVLLAAVPRADVGRAALLPVRLFVDAPAPVPPERVVAVVR